MQEFLEKINDLREHGDSIRVARLVNKRRVSGGLSEITDSYVNAQLNGDRPMTKVVKEVAEAYFKVQEQIKKELAV